MRITHLKIDRFGVWNGLALADLSDGLNVIYGPPGSGKSSIADFLRTVLYGFGHDIRQRYVTWQSQSVGGALTVAGPRGQHVIRRHSDGDSQGRLVMENEHGELAGKSQLLDLLGGVPQAVYERVFVVDFRQSLDAGRLIDEAAAQGLDILGGEGDPSRLADLRGRLAQLQQQLAELGSAGGSAADLAERRRSLQREIDLQQAARQDARATAERQRQELLHELADLQQQRQELEAELRAADSDLTDREEEYRRREESFRQARLDQQRRRREHRERLAEIETQLQRWNQVLRDVEIRRERMLAERVSAELGEDAASADPRHYLRLLEEQVEQLQQSLRELGPADDKTCRCRQLQSLVTPALEAMREDIYRLCNHLSLWQTTARRQESAGEASQLQRCEVELRQAIAGLTLRRQRLLSEAADHDAAGHVVQPAIQDLCRCAEHGSAWDEGDDADGLSAEEEALLSALRAEINRLVQRRRDIQADLQEVLAEIQDQQQRLDQLQRDIDHPAADLRLETLRQELLSITRQVSDAERRQELLANMADFERQIRELEAAGRKPSILQEAAELLRRLTRGQLQQVSVAPDHTVWFRDRADLRLAWDQLDTALRAHAYLSLCLAVVAAYGRQGTRLPAILQHAFEHADPEHLEDLLQLLCDFGQRGHQVLLLTGSQPLADRARTMRLALRELSPAAQHASQPETAAVPEEVNWQLLAIADEANRAHELEEQPHFSAEEFPGELTDRVRLQAARGVTPLPAWDEDLLSDYFLLEASPIQEAPSIDAATAERFRKIGVLLVGDLLRADVEETAERLRHAGITAAMIRRWKAESLLACRVPRLRPYDARILVACGIEDPDQLAAIEAGQLRSRVEAFAATSVGQTLIRAGNRYELSRLTEWIHAAQRLQRHREVRPADRSSSRQRMERRRPRFDRDESSRPGSELRATREAPDTGPAREPRAAREPREVRAARRREGTAQAAGARSEPRPVVLTMPEGSGSLRFYLDLGDPIENAPSIGPRTAERMERIGIRLVRDFLQADAAAAAEKLGHRYITAEVIRQWQLQTTLVCRIPHLRGHDAQILVACGISDPESLAAMEAMDLWQRVEPFVETNEGRRIVRSGKAPDFAEVYGWIQSAAQARQLRAA